MKKGIHPEYNKQALIVCNSCGNQVLAGSTSSDIVVEVCSNCHPFYTGKTEEIAGKKGSQVERFRTKAAAANTDKVLLKRKKKAKRMAKTSEVSSGPKITLKDMIKQSQKKDS